MTRVIFAEGSSSDEMTVWLTLILAFAALLLTAYWNRRTERRNSLDEYWFRQIVAPKCITPILGIHDDWQAKLDTLPDKWDQALVHVILDDFEGDMRRTLESMWIARIFSSSFYLQSSESFFRVEDVFATQCGQVLCGKRDVSLAKVAIKQALGDASVEILSRAAKLHGGKLNAVS